MNKKYYQLTKDIKALKKEFHEKTKDYEFFYDGHKLMIESLNKRAFDYLKTFDKSILKHLDCYFMVLNETKFFKIIMWGK